MLELYQTFIFLSTKLLPPPHKIRLKKTFSKIILHVKISHRVICIRYKFYCKKYFLKPTSHVKNIAQSDFHMIRILYNSAQNPKRNKAQNRKQRAVFLDLFCLNECYDKDTAKEFWFSKVLNFSKNTTFFSSIYLKNTAYQIVHMPVREQITAIRLFGMYALFYRPFRFFLK